MPEITVKTANSFSLNPPIRKKMPEQRNFSNPAKFYNKVLSAIIFPDLNYRRAHEKLHSGD
jgi:hypothetical protein